MSQTKWKCSVSGELESQTQKIEIIYFIHSVYIKMKNMPIGKAMPFPSYASGSAMQGRISRETVLSLIASPLGQLLQYGFFPFPEIIS